MTGTASKVLWYRFDPNALFDQQYEVWAVSGALRGSTKPQFYSILGFQAVRDAYVAEGYDVREMTGAEER